MTAEQIHTFFRWAWCNPVITLPLLLTFTFSVLIFICQLIKLQEYKRVNKKYNKKYIILAILSFVTFLITFFMYLLLDFSFTPMEFPSLFGDQRVVGSSSIGSSTIVLKLFIPSILRFKI